MGEGVSGAGSSADLLAGIDDSWWDDSDHARRAYAGLPVDDEIVDSVEAELGYRLPVSYVALMRRHNGGMPRLRCFPTATPTSWADDHVALTGILGIGRSPDNSLCGARGSAFWVREWGYPDVGVYFADCPSAGHMIAMDYRSCGAKGEPRIVHVDQERDYAVTVLADSFASFVLGLRGEDAYP